MADRRTEAKRRRWADVVVIVSALYVFLAAIWSPPALGPAEAATEAVDHGWWWWAHAVGGFLALLSVPLAQKRPPLGKALAGLAGLIMLAGMFAFGGVSWLSVRALGLPGLAVLLSAAFIGPMPSPEEEGVDRGAALDPRKDVRARRPEDR